MAVKLIMPRFEAMERENRDLKVRVRLLEAWLEQLIDAQGRDPEKVEEVTAAARVVLEDRAP